MNESVQNLFDKVKATAQTAGRATGQALDQAGKKAGGQLEIIKLNIQVNEHEKNISEILTKVGQLVYTAHTNPNANTEGIDEMLKEIDEHHDEIKKLKARIDHLKQIKACPACQKTLDIEDSFCRYCGKDA